MTPKETLEKKIGFKLNDAQFDIICKKLNIYSTINIINHTKTYPGELAKYAQMIVWAS